MKNKLKRYKQKLKEKGYIKREVWILKENISKLKILELKLRQKGINMNEYDVVAQETRPICWDTKTLVEALAETPEFKDGIFSLEVETNDVITVTVTDYEEFPIFLSISGEQILAMSFLWNVSDIINRASLNEELLRANTIVPLSDFAIVGDSYVLFGALSVESQIQEVVTEVITLTENTVDAIESYGDLN